MTGEGTQKGRALVQLGTRRLITMVYGWISYWLDKEVALVLESYATNFHFESSFGKIIQNCEIMQNCEQVFKEKVMQGLTLVRFCFFGWEFLILGSLRERIELKRKTRGQPIMLCGRQNIAR